MAYPSIRVEEIDKKQVVIIKVVEVKCIKFKGIGVTGEMIDLRTVGGDVFEQLIEAEKFVFTEFLHYYLSNLYNFIRNLTGDNDRSGLSMAKIRQILLMVPEINEQIEIGNALQCLDNKIEMIEKKKQTLTSLFKTPLHELMTGQHRVHELEFNEDLTL